MIEVDRRDASNSAGAATYAIQSTAITTVDTRSKEAQIVGSASGGSAAVSLSGPRPPRHGLAEGHFYQNIAS